MLSHQRVGGDVEERRQSKQRVTPDRRKSPRRVRRLPIAIERRATGDRRKGERRTFVDRREEATKLTCPVCRGDIVGFDLTLNHLMEVHGISNRQATLLTKKMVEWKQEKLDPTLFPPDYDTHFRGSR